MGYANWSGTTYRNIRRNYRGKSCDDIFTSNKRGRIAPEMNPYGLTFRESRDSQNHPNSLAISMFLDVTGSMGRIPEHMVRHKLGTLIDTMIDYGVKDPQVMFSAIGDHYTDRFPLQVGQFESGAEEMNNCLASIFLEGGGGGQIMESYLLAWLIAGRHTSMDCWEKRRQKGFLFTVGDEANWNELSAGHLKQLMGYKEAYPVDAEVLLSEAERTFNVYHIHINQTGYRNHPKVLGYWKELLGERLLVLDDYNVLAELVSTIVSVGQGIKYEDIVNHFDDNTTKLLDMAITH